MCVSCLLFSTKERQKRKTERVDRKQSKTVNEFRRATINMSKQRHISKRRENTRNTTWRLCQTQAQVQHVGVLLVYARDKIRREKEKK